MPTAAAVMGDRVNAQCVTHLIPNPATGVPQPSPPLPFSAPLMQNLSTQTLIGGKPVVLAGSTGNNTPPHVGLHPSDPFMVPVGQLAAVTGGSATVLVEGRPIAHTGSPCTVCAGAPGQLVGSAADVLVGD